MEPAGVSKDPNQIIGRDYAFPVALQRCLSAHNCSDAAGGCGGPAFCTGPPFLRAARTGRGPRFREHVCSVATALTRFGSRDARSFPSFRRRQKSPRKLSHISNAYI